MLLDIFTGTYKTNPTLMIGAQGEEQRLEGLLDETRFYLRYLAPHELRSLAVVETPAQIAAATNPNAVQHEKLLHFNAAPILHCVIIFDPTATSFFTNM